jgi:hypothetical protein
MPNKFSSKLLGEVEVVLKELTHEIAAALRPSILSYFDKSCGARFLLTDAAKVVARLEVRKSGAYLDVSLGRVGEEGKIYCHKALAIELNQEVPSNVQSVRLTRSQIEELRLQKKLPQPTYGRSRARVQNRLVGLGFSSFEGEGFLCTITKPGLSYLESHPVKARRRKP